MGRKVDIRTSNIGLTPNNLELSNLKDEMYKATKTKQQDTNNFRLYNKKLLFDPCFKSLEKSKLFLLLLF